MKKSNPQGYYSCPTCQIGHLGAKKVLFFHQGAIDPIIAPQFPGWICDLCGDRFYDPDAMFRLRAMLWASRSNHQMTQAKTDKQGLPSHSEKGELRRRS
jgi:hypothetical protein